MPSPEVRFRVALGLLIACTIAWPVSQLTWARHEPPTTLGLSWFAIVITCIDVICTTDVRRQDQDTPPVP